MFKIIQFHKWECWLVMGNNVSGKLGPVVYIESMGWCFEIQVKVILVGSVFPSWFWFFSIGRFFSIKCKKTQKYKGVWFGFQQLILTAVNSTFLLTIRYCELKSTRGYDLDFNSWFITASLQHDYKLKCNQKYKRVWFGFW